MPLHPFETRLAVLWPPDEWLDLTVLVAVSGGADSVALLRAVAALKTGGAGRLCVAHFNHKLRSGRRRPAIRPRLVQSARLILRNRFRRRGAVGRRRGRRHRTRRTPGAL